MNKTDAELAEVFRTIVTLRINGVADDSEEVAAIHESIGEFSYDDLVRMSGMGALMTCNILILLSESLGATPQIAWEFACQHGRERGLPGMT